MLSRGDSLHQSTTPHGILEVIQDQDTRSLYFGNQNKQSSMLLQDPIELILPYTQTMMASLLFIQKLKRVLMIGLGGGSIVKYLHYYYPACHIDVVEFNPYIPKLAHQYFHLPEHPNINIIIDDGGKFIQEMNTNSPPYDLILIDAYDTQGMSQLTDGMTFYNCCLQQLSESGLCTINLWRSQYRRYIKSKQHLKRIFDKKLCVLPVISRMNEIVIAGAFPLQLKRPLLIDELPKQVQIMKKILFSFKVLSQNKL